MTTRLRSIRLGALGALVPLLTAGAQDVTVQDTVIQHFRPYTQSGINVFEAPKTDSVRFTGMKLKVGAAFTQQYQGLDHENTAVPVMTTPAPPATPVNTNQLMTIGNGFNNAVANLYLDAQLMRGIRVALTTYLSSRHHNETWVKDGYLLVDASPWDVDLLNTVMQYVTLRVGHFEVNYGDAHFRRTDNGNAMYNPFVGNYILDAFTTEVGGEVYFKHPSGLLAMVGATGGEIRGNVTQPQNRSPALLAKLGVDRQLTPMVRGRLTGSLYRVSKSPGSTLYAGDRAGSRYYMVLENTTATESGNFTSGLVNPQFRRSVTAMQLNPFVKVGGLELFGVVERSKGRNTAAEASQRTWKQYAIDGVYRFLPREQAYVGARYNTVRGDLNFGTGAAATTSEVGIDRVEVGGGFFITSNILLKAEYVSQVYDDFPTTDIRNGGKFDGFVVEGTVAF
jgi:hypothetical protein